MDYALLYMFVAIGLKGFRILTWVLLNLVNYQVVCATVSFSFGRMSSNSAVLSCLCTSES